MDVFKLDIESLSVETFETEAEPFPTYDVDDGTTREKTDTLPCCC